MPMTFRPAHARAAVLCGVLLLGGCSSAAAAPASSNTPLPTAPPSSHPSAASPVTTDPGDPAGGGTGRIGGGVPGNPGTGSGIGLPIGAAPVDPGAGQPTIVLPKPGRLNPHPVAPIALASSIDGRRVLVKVTWYGGIAPCSVLDSVAVARSGNTIEITVVEGSDAVDAICPELAMLKATIVDLGDLEPGPWSIRATNSDVARIEVTIA